MNYAKKKVYFGAKKQQQIIGGSNMRFYGKMGRQCLDLSNDLILTTDANLVPVTNQKKYAPKAIHGATYIVLGALSFWQKVKACYRVCIFIFKAKKLLQPKVTPKKTTT